MSNYTKVEFFENNVRKCLREDNFGWLLMIAVKVEQTRQKNKTLNLPLRNSKYKSCLSYFYFDENIETKLQQRSTEIMFLALPVHLS